ncbi:MAG TPA: integrase core domain-containing protein [Actinomycetes bacterium]|nr:integrase core domain-containing protein [Actinomycetes bacterium]
MMRADGHQASTSTVERALRRRGLLPRGLRADRETARFRDIYNRIRPHQALDDRTPRQASLDT